MSRTSTAFHKLVLRKNRTRAKLAANQEIPRLSVHRTLRAVYVQIIDDKKGVTLASTSDHTLKATGTKTERARLVGTTIAKLAKEKKIAAVRFDRGGHKYHGRIAALADAAREEGLQL